MANGNIEISKLIDWLATTRHNGSDPFRNIDEVAGIYKIYVNDEDKDKLIFATNKTLAKDTREGKDLENIYKANLMFEKNEKKHVLYIGKAENLRKRIRQYMRMSFGGKGHKGGIDIWAITNYKEYLHVEWFELELQYDNAEDMEGDEIYCFKQTHQGNRPLANRKDGKKRR